MGGARMSRGNMVPGFVICYAPGMVVAQNEHVLFSLSHQSVLQAANSNTQYALYNENGEAYRNDPNVRVNEPAAVLPFFVESTIADQIAGMQHTAEIRGFAAYSGYTSASSPGQAHRRGRGRLTRVPRQIVDQVASALQTDSLVPSNAGLDQDFQSFLSKVDSFRGSNFATAMQRMSSVLMPWRDRVFIGYLAFRR